MNVYLEPRPRPPCPRGARRQRSAEEAVRAAAAFLIDARGEDCWTDFSLPVGTSTVWVTAYTLARLAGIPGALLPGGAPSAIARSIRWLMRVQTIGGGWGYNPEVPDDADSTAWAVIALRRHHAAVPGDAKNFLLRCRGGGGSFATYPRHTSPRSAWAAAAPDVSAVVMCALGEPWSAEAESRFSRWRTPDGLLPAYWWVSPFYTLALLLESYPGPATRAFASPAVARLDPAAAPSAFDLALLLSSLSALDDPRTAHAAAELSRRQRGDGSWTPSARLRLPGPDVRAPWGAIDAGPTFVDQRAIFTTATGAAALSLFLSRC